MTSARAEARPAALAGPWRLVAWAIAGSLAALCLVYSSVRVFHGDELEAIHTAWKILQGEGIYSGFFQHHHPLLYFALVPVVWAFGEGPATLFACRALMFGVGVANLALTARLTLRYLGDRTAAACSPVLMLLFLPFSHFGFQVRPDELMLTFELAAVLELHAFLERGRMRSLAASAACLGVAFLVLQKAAFFAAIVFGILGVEWLRRRIRLAHLFAYAGVFLLTLAPFYAVFLAKGMLGPYVLLNWRVNQLMLKGSRGMSLDVVGQALVSSFPCVLLFAVGLKGLWRQERLWQPLVLALGMLAAVAFVPGAFLWYLLPALPFMAIIAARGASTLLSEWPRLARVALLALVPVVAWHVQVHVSKLGRLGGQLERVGELQALTAPDEIAYDASLKHLNLFRRDADWFWYNVPGPNSALANYQKLTGYQYDPYEIVRRTRPRWIWVGEDFLDPAEPAIAEGYAPSRIDGVWLRK